jgi:hypothetical protein
MTAAICRECGQTTNDPYWVGPTGIKRPFPVCENCHAEEVLGIRKNNSRRNKDKRISPRRYVGQAMKEYNGSFVEGIDTGDIIWSVDDC